jgi:hypothetical protein
VNSHNSYKKYSCSSVSCTDAAERWRFYYAAKKSRECKQQQRNNAMKRASGSRLPQHERNAMELWLKNNRIYHGGKGKEMSNLRWINGGASKGLTSVSGDSKQAKSISAHEELAKFVNERCNLAGAERWDAAKAASKWQNMKSTFKRVVRKYEFPEVDQWLKDGRTKEEHAEEIERLTALRRKGCQSYDVRFM